MSVLGPDGRLASLRVDSLGRLTTVAEAVGEVVTTSGVTYTVQRELAKFWNLTIRGRAAQIISGGRRDVWTPPVGFDISRAVYPATNDQAGLAAAITTAAGRATNKLVLVPQSITLTSNIVASVAGTSDQPVIIASLSGAVISGNFAVMLHSYTHVIGLTFNGSHLYADVPTGYTGLRPIGNLFLNCGSMGGVYPYASGGIGDATTGDNSQHTNWDIALNEFKDCGWAIYSQRLSNSQIRYNKVWYSAANYSDRGLWFVGCNNNRILHNWIEGGRVGIAFLADRSLTQSIEGNEFGWNVVRHISEEGISIDGYGNNGSKCAIADRLTVASTAGTVAASPKIVCNRANTNGIHPGGNHAVQVTSGPMVGRYFRIIGAGSQVAGTSIYLQFENNSLSTADLAALVGAQVTVVIHCANNSFHDNIVEDAQTPIMLWGMGHRTSIVNNWCSASGTGVAGANGSGLFGISAAIGLWGIGIPAGPTAPTDGTSDFYPCLPSMCIVQGNYCASGGIVICGLTWGSQAATEAAQDPIPHFIGGNNVAPTVQAWRNGNNVSQLYTEPVGVVTDIGGAYDEDLLLATALPLPA